jgi:glycosyltransferase involved in cell wall biosynthesis
MKIIEVSLSGTIGRSLMGPVSSIICELSNRFTRCGHEVTLVDVAAGGARELLESTVKVAEIPGPARQAAPSGKTTAGWLLAEWRNYYRCVRAIAARVDLERADVIHYHDPIPAFIAQRLYPYPIAYTAHTPLWSLGPGAQVPGRAVTFLGALLPRINEWLERSVVRHGKPSIGLGRYLGTSVPGACVAAIPSGVNLDAFVPAPTEESRGMLGLSANDFVVLCVARPAPEKGLDLLIEAARDLWPQLSRLKVLIVGPLSGAFESGDNVVSGYTRDLMQQARGLPVQFVGFVSRYDARFRHYMSAADVFVLPSRLEPQGLVVLESLAMGTPVIASEVGAIPDMVNDDVGYLFARGDVKSLAGRIREAYQDQRGLLRRRSACRAWVEANFSWERVAERYLAAFAAAGAGKHALVSAL